MQEQISDILRSIEEQVFTSQQHRTIDAILDIYNGRYSDYTKYYDETKYEIEYIRKYNERQAYEKGIIKNFLEPYYVEPIILKIYLNIF